MPESGNLKIEKSVRYYLSGSPNAKYDAVCFALHGYGQLGEYFIRPFCDDALTNILFIAPEGPHRFYLDKEHKRVGASWMTREDRLKDIEDYCHYLDQLYHLFEAKINAVGKVGVLGFSQGVATACRWLSYSDHSFDFLVNYAGIYPPDLPLEQAIEKMKNIPVKLVLGTEDEYITEERFRSALVQFKQEGFPVALTMFEGKHKIYPGVLGDLFEEII